MWIRKGSESNDCASRLIKRNYDCVSLNIEIMIAVSKLMKEVVQTPNNVEEGGMGEGEGMQMRTSMITSRSIKSRRATFNNCRDVHKKTFTHE